MSFWMKGLGISSFVGGAITLFVFILGILLIRFRNLWAGVPYGFFGFSIGLLVLVVGALMAAPNSF
jgi:hypothetical protein